MVWFGSWFAVLSLFCCYVSASIDVKPPPLYSFFDDVIPLTGPDFNRLVVGSGDVWMVVFSVNWCPHCQGLAPLYKRAASSLKGVVKFGAVDVDAESTLADRYNVETFPTLKVFVSGVAQDFQGERTVQNLIAQALSAARIHNHSIQQYSRDERIPGEVIELTDSNFAEQVSGCGLPWLVAFYAPWCGHCKDLAPEWKEVADLLNGKVNVAAIDATAHTSTASQYEVKRYPTIVLLDPRELAVYTEYNGQRIAGGIVDWVSRQMEHDVVPVLC